MSFDPTSPPIPARHDTRVLSGQAGRYVCRCQITSNHRLILISKLSAPSIVAGAAYKSRHMRCQDRLVHTRHGFYHGSLVDISAKACHGFVDALHVFGEDGKVHVDEGVVLESRLGLGWRDAPEGVVDTILREDACSVCCGFVQVQVLRDEADMG